MSYTPPPPGDRGPYGAPGSVPGAQGLPKPAQLLDRFAAHIIDALILAAVAAVLLVPLVSGVIITGGDSGTVFVAGVVGTVLSTLLGWGYFIVMESQRGATLGKMVMGLRVVGPTGQLPTVEQAARRDIVMAAGFLGLLPVVGNVAQGLASLIGAITIAVAINNDPVNRQGWHDHFAGGTRVLKVR